MKSQGHAAPKNINTEKQKETKVNTTKQKRNEINHAAFMKHAQFAFFLIHKDDNDLPCNIFQLIVALWDLGHHWFR